LDSGSFKELPGKKENKINKIRFIFDSFAFVGVFKL